MKFLRLKPRNVLVVIALNLVLTSCGRGLFHESDVNNSVKKNISRSNNAVYPACSPLCVEIAKKPNFANILCGTAVPAACSVALNALIPGGYTLKIAKYALNAGGLLSGFGMGACFDVFSYGNCSRALNCTRYIFRQDQGSVATKFFYTQIDCYRSFCKDIKNSSDPYFTGYKSWCKINQM